MRSLYSLCFVLITLTLIQSKEPPVNQSKEPSADQSKESPVDFVKEVAPIFQEHCLRCHHTGNSKGDFSLSTEADLKSSQHVMAGKPDESQLLRVVIPAREGAKPRMPKQGKSLSEAEVNTLRRWIREGASWPKDYVLKEKAKADGTWWSLQPLRVPNIPNPKELPKEWNENPIDRFIFAQLQTKGLTPNPPADKRMLIRRVTFDLTGLPPTPEEVERFLQDHSADAYEKLVDRLLASPRYGEHWGRHWLDVVRFGESNGYERNVLINNVWPFRDYIIKSFNEGKPFDQLVREHLAGDVIGKDDPEKEIGTAFLVCGPYDNVGNSDAKQAALIRANHLDEMIRTTSEAFLGLTFGCARCHDHKFDPISQKDYFSLYATFAGVHYGDRPLLTAEQRALLDAKKLDLKTIPKKWAGTFDPNIAKQTFKVHLGGDPSKLGEAVTPSSLGILKHLESRYELPANAPETQRRLALAQWITAPDNPLTARVLANRLWHYHFGVGIVDTPSDFGWMGSKPTHPELLDFLAHRVHQEKWKLKPIHKLIVTSQTYRQSSKWNETAAKIDADSRLLWRFPPRRLSGEELRDAMLSFAGLLDHEKEKGGPGFRLYKYVEDNVATYHPLDQHGPETYRRAVYHQNARAARTDVLSDFDCPDPAAAAPRRASTTTPLQALTLLNHQFTHDMAKRLAERIKQKAGDRPENQIQLLFEWVYHRPATEWEQKKIAPILTEHGLAIVCLAVLNSNELLYLP